MSENIEDKIAFIENNFKVINKEGSLVSMKLYKSQRHFMENKTNRNAVLKGRQMGESTGHNADDAETLFTEPFQRMTIITHDTETSEFLFQNVQRFYRNLPINKGKSDKEMQPIHDWKSGTRMRFPKIDSYIYVDSAKSDTIAIGHTITRAHCSEVARWPQRKGEQLWSDVTQAVPLSGIITAESTPRGRVGLWHTIYQEAKNGTNGFTPFFYPWFWDEGYFADPSIYLTGEKAELIASILGQSTASFLKDERAFAEYHKLSPPQLAFRRLKIGEIKLLFFQEYPENDIDCWLSNEMAVIDGTTLRPYYAKIESGIQMGDLTIWNGVIGGHNYVIGVDVASGSSRDYSVASVLDTRTLKYVARIRGKIHTDLFAQQLFDLGIRYNMAKIAVERINHGHSVLRILLEKNYPNLYYHSDYNDFLKQNITDVGWVTSGRTKLPMVNGMITMFRSGELISFSENLLLESSGLTWEGQVDSRIQTPPGGNDDEFIAVSIALQVMELEPIIYYDEKRPRATSYARI